MPIDSHPDAIDAVRRRIAAAIVPPPVPRTLGTVTLHPHQQDAIAQLLDILPRHHGALLADDVGLGKTFVALAVAQRYTEVHCLAPAPLCHMWRDAAAQAGLHDLQLHSLHAIARGTPPTFGDGTRALVIIDEAHALRNPKTARYRAVAKACAGADVLLISATPLHNRPHDLRALFALFAGARADALMTNRLTDVIVRRRAADLPLAPDARPALVQHPPITMPQDEATVSLILALPAPLPARDGAIAGALIRMGLLRAWCSSDAALARTLHRRRLRTAALRDILKSGRHATQEELRTWLVSEAAGQLAFPELLVNHAVESGPLLEIVDRHLDALTALATHHNAVAQADPQRAATLRALLGRHDGTPVVAFSHSGATIDALFRALRDIAGIAMLNGATARIASGVITRHEVLETFAPLAHGRAPPPAHQRIRLLLTTDLLAEGVNLQDAGVIVHLDLPWTAARHDQRIGRCLRLGSPHRTVHAYRFMPSALAEQALRTEQRIVEKARLHRDFIGSSAIRHRRTRSAAEHASHHRTMLYARLEEWRTLIPDRDTPARAESRLAQGVDTRQPPKVVIQQARRSGALLRYEEWTMVDTGSGVRRHTGVIALLPHKTKAAHTRPWRHHSSMQALRTLVDASTEASLESHAGFTTPMTERRSEEQHLREVRSMVRRGWQRFRRTMHARTTMGTPAREQRLLARRMTQEIMQAVQQLPQDQRALLRFAIEAARRCVACAQGAAADAALRHWATQRDHLTPREWLMAWRQDPVLTRLGNPDPTPSIPDDASRRRLVLRDVLLLVHITTHG